MEPATMRAGSSSKFIIDFAATLLPEPDSPTMPRVSPRRSVKLTPSTARTTPASVKNQVRRSLTCSSGSASSGIRVEPVAQAVAYEVEADYHRQDRYAREGRHPPLRDQLAPFGDHGAPFRHRRHPAEAAEREAGAHQYRVAEVERDQNDQRADGIGQDLAEQNVGGRKPDGAGQYVAAQLVGTEPMRQ